MQKTSAVLLILLASWISFLSSAQNKTIAFVSDTQKPMWIEDVFLKSNQNEKATSLIFQSMIEKKPTAIYILGDVVSLGYKEKKWKKLDQYLEQCRVKGIEVNALLGNHDVMTKPKKGEQTFQKRFPNHQRLGYVSVTDSIAIVLLNSNFKKLTSTEVAAQNQWLEKTLTALDHDDSILMVIVSCHHSPYTNSKIVMSSKEVHDNFVPPYLESKKSTLFLTGHSHNFEHFKKQGKDFMVIGGGGGIHQPTRPSTPSMDDMAKNYKPMFHYLLMERVGSNILMHSYFLSSDFKEFNVGYTVELSAKK
jgi:UDP-2,3-diacylglucosamine pyrophosphatase LpxH